MQQAVGELLASSGGGVKNVGILAPWFGDLFDEFFSTRQ